jgi:hypothetical protein
MVDVDSDFEDFEEEMAEFEAEFNQAEEDTDEFESYPSGEESEEVPDSPPPLVAYPHHIPSSTTEGSPSWEGFYEDAHPRRSPSYDPGTSSDAFSNQDLDHPHVTPTSDHINGSTMLTGQAGKCNISVLFHYLTDSSSAAEDLKTFAAEYNRIYGKSKAPTGAEYSTPSQSFTDSDTLAYPSMKSDEKTSRPIAAFFAHAEPIDEEFVQGSSSAQLSDKMDIDDASSDITMYDSSSIGNSITDQSDEQGNSILPAIVNAVDSRALILHPIYGRGAQNTLVPARRFHPYARKSRRLGNRGKRRV